MSHRDRSQRDRERDRDRERERDRDRDRDRDRERDRDRDRDRDRNRDNRESRRDYRKDDDKQNGKRKHERSPLRRDESRSKHRENEDRSKRRKDFDYTKKNEDYNKPKKSSFEESKNEKEPVYQWGKNTETVTVNVEKEKPNFGTSGKLTEDTNTVNGVVIKYSEPSDARKPKRRWRLYPFKGEKALPTLYIHRQSAYLLGRDRKIADIPLDHPSCSKQHAALQYRLVSFQKEGGGKGMRIRPYLIDLESANGTYVNNVKMEPRKYHELLERDVIKFGFSSREYVLLHEHSKDDSLDDDVPTTAT